MCLSCLGAVSNSQAVRGPGEPVRQARELSEGFNWNIPFKCRRLKPWFDIFQRISEEQSTKAGIFLFLRGTCSGNSRGNPWSLITSLHFVRLPSSWPCHGQDSLRWPPAQNYGFSSSHVWMWELDHKEGWVPKYWCFWIVVLTKTLESLLDSKEIKPINPEGSQSWFHCKEWCWILWPLDAKSQLFGKDLDAGEDWRQKKGIAEDEMVR